MPEQTAPPPPPAPEAPPAGWTADEQEAAPAAPPEPEHPQTTWICENPRCVHAGKRRRVNWQHLGQGLYLVGTVRCACGFPPVREPKVRQ